jgi:hypothetical protein
MNSPSFLTPKAADQTDRPTSDRTCLLVLGMHRSGTSAMTRLLSMAGAKLPATLLGAGRGNEAGHWESSALLAYHDRLLHTLGSDWSDWRALEIGKVALGRRRDIKAEIADLIASEYRDAPLFVLKDPRICRFAPLFLEALDEAGIGVRIVHMLRNPLEVAESLERRDGLSRSDTVLQWLRHVLDSEAATRGRERVIVSYASLLQDWRGAFDRVSELLRVAWPYAADDIAPQVSEFLVVGRRHHTHTTEDVLLDPAIKDWAGEAYSALLVLEHNPASKAAMLALDAVRREFDHAAPVLYALQAEVRSAAEEAIAGLRSAADKQLAEAVTAADKRLAEATSQADRKIADAKAAADNRLAEVNAELDRRAAALVEREHELAALRLALEGEQARAEKSEAALAERQNHVKVLEDEVRAADARSAQLAAALQEHALHQERLTAALSKKAAGAERLTGALAESERQASSLEAEVRLVVARAADADAALAMRNEEVALLQAALAEAEVTASDLKALAEAHERKLKQSERQKAVLLQQAQMARQELIEHFHTSTSWKLTRPLRALKDVLPRLPRRSRMTARSAPFAKVAADDASIIAESGLFDVAYYLALVGDARIKDPIAHYLQHGFRRGIDPNPLFDSDYYATLYAGELQENVLPIVHFIKVGSSKGFDPSRLFQTSYYSDSNLAARGSGKTALAHYLESGRVAGRMPIDVDPSTLNPLALELHRLDMAGAKADAFNVDLYATLNPELEDAYGRDRDALLQHYRAAGEAEGRIATLGAFLRDAGLPPEAVPINFDPAEYFDLNGDLASALPSNFFHALQHYLRWGIKERRKYSFAQCYIEPPWRQSKAPRPAEKPMIARDAKKAACLVHVYYPELWPELSGYIRNLDGVARDVFVNVADSMWSEELHALIRSDVPDAQITISENKGRDIGGHLQSLKGIAIDTYSAFFLLHTKKSRHFSQAYSENWRKSLLQPLLGTPDKVVDNLALMRTDPKVGIIGAAAWRHSGVDKNAEKYAYLLRRFGIKPSEADCDYVSGTMMIVRPDILRRIFDVLSEEEFESADGKSDDWLRDGQLEHAAERLFANVCRSLGYRIHWC